MLLCAAKYRRVDIRAYFTIWEVEKAPVQLQLSGQYFGAGID